MTTRTQVKLTCEGGATITYWKDQETPDMVRNLFRKNKVVSVENQEVVIAPPKVIENKQVTN